MRRAPSFRRRSLEEGKVKEERDSFDLSSMASQLGLVPESKLLKGVVEGLEARSGFASQASPVPDHGQSGDSVEVGVRTEEGLPVRKRGAGH